MSKHRKRESCDRLVTFCLYKASTDIVDEFQKEVKRSESISIYSRERAINRIISEWKELRKLLTAPHDPPPTTHPADHLADDYRR